MSNDTSNKPSSTRFLVPKAPWGPWYAVMGTILAFLGGQIIAQIVIAQYVQLNHWSRQHANYTFTITIIGQFWSVLVIEATVLSLLWLFIRRFPREAIIKGLGLRRIHWKDVGFTFVGVLAYFGVYSVILSISNQFMHVDVGQQQNIGFTSPTGTASLILTFVSLVVLPPIAEELMFRGFLYGGLRRKLNVVIATLVTSVLFALPHAAESASGGVLWIAAIDTFSLSLVLCFLRERTGAVYSGIGLHAIKNSIAFVSLFILHVR